MYPVIMNHDGCCRLVLQKGPDIPRCMLNQATSEQPLAFSQALPECSRLRSRHSISFRAHPTGLPDTRFRILFESNINTVLRVASQMLPYSPAAMSAKRAPCQKRRWRFSQGDKSVSQFSPLQVNSSRLR